MSAKYSFPSAVAFVPASNPGAVNHDALHISERQFFFKKYISNVSRSHDQAQNLSCSQVSSSIRKVDIRLPGKGNSNPHGAKPVHLIITLMKWIRTSRLSIKNSLSLFLSAEVFVPAIPQTLSCLSTYGAEGLIIDSQKRWMVKMRGVFEPRPP